MSSADVDPYAVVMQALQNGGLRIFYQDDGWAYRWAEWDFMLPIMAEAVQSDPRLRGFASESAAVAAALCGWIDEFAEMKMEHEALVSSYAHLLNGLASIGLVVRQEEASAGATETWAYAWVVVSGTVASQIPVVLSLLDYASVCIQLIEYPHQPASRCVLQCYSLSC